MEKNKKKPVRIAISSDLHLLSKDLNDNKDAYANNPYNEDRTKLIKRMLDEICQGSFDLLLINGDLTYNGEHASHMEMAKMLQKVKDAGIRVFVLPGNHDIGRPDAKGFCGEEAYQVPTVTEDDFVKIYKEFGYDQAMARDPHSLSYIVKISEESWLFCLDNCARDRGISQNYGAFSEGSLRWLEEFLIKAKQEDVYPIVAGHYNLACHNKVFRNGFTMQNNRLIGEMLYCYDALLFLSGHMHMQHMKIQSGIMDIVTSAPTTYPHQYGSLWIENGNKALYHTKKITMSEEERKQCWNMTMKTFSDQVYEEISCKNNLTEEEKQRMAAFAAKMNLCYFSGRFFKMEKELEDSEEWLLWIKEANDTFFYKYLSSMMSDSMRNHNGYEGKIEERE